MTNVETPSAAPEGGETSDKTGVPEGKAVEPTSIPSSASEGGETSGGKDTSGSLDRLPETPSAAAE